LNNIKKANEILDKIENEALKTIPQNFKLRVLLASKNFYPQQFINNEFL